MQIRKLGILLPIGLGILLLIGMVLLLPASSADAQCGSQASSCKNCHETQGKDPVNSDGTGWHTGHAFGDFCYICHAGNNQSMDQEQAHAGMVDPLSDVNAACASCHPADLTEQGKCICGCTWCRSWNRRGNDRMSHRHPATHKAVSQWQILQPSQQHQPWSFHPKQWSITTRFMKRPCLGKIRSTGVMSSYG